MTPTPQTGRTPVAPTQLADAPHDAAAPGTAWLLEPSDAADETP